MLYLTRKVAAIKRLLPTAAAVYLLLSCSQATPDQPRPHRDATPQRASTPRPPATPPPVPADAAKENGAGSFEQYKFLYTKAGQQVVADFKPQKLPHTNQNVVVAAARNVIRAAYGEEMKNFPRLVAWEYKNSKNGIKLEGDKYDYVFVPVKDEDKAISQLIFWRVEKGAVED